MWTNYFDKIFLINLAKRTDRLEQATEQLNKYNIPFERVEAIEMLDGAEGLRLTMVGVFERAIENNWQNILVFEDDMDIIEDTFTEVMEEVVQQMPVGYDLVYLGGQMCSLPTTWYWHNMISVRNFYATHAVIYSLKAIKSIMAQNFTAPIDNCLVQIIQSKGDCYCIYPLLLSQIISKSDIYSDKPEIDWKPYIEGKYYKQIEKMRLAGNFTREPKK
jgi:GR25 family glycosyltransferase involved in LPS biosynthesis